MKFLLLAWFSSLAFGATGQRLLSGPQLQVLKQQDCAFVHVWATWCTLCKEEMPKLLETLSKAKKAHPVIIDVSTPYVQDSESRKWMASLNPPFVTYLKPKGDDVQYMEQVDKNWDGGLPFTILFDKGVKKQSWVGSLPLDEIKKVIETTCR